VESFVRQTLSRADDVGNRRALSLCYHALGAVQYLRGEWQESIHALQRSIALALSFGGTFGEVLGEQRFALTETALGLYTPAYDRLRRALHVARQSDNLMVRWHSIGRILTTITRNRFEAGDLPAAATYLAECLAVQQEIGECPGCDVLLYPVAVPIYLALGQMEEAEATCRKAEEIALAFRSQAWIGAARHVRGLVAQARGEWDEAARRLIAARDTFEALGQPYDVALALEALGDVAAVAGPSTAFGDAATSHKQAAALYARLGAAGDSARLAQKAASHQFLVGTAGRHIG
jgi:tetratricopeptide (TPR) repeat protein